MHHHQDLEEGTDLLAYSAPEAVMKAAPLHKATLVRSSGQKLTPARHSYAPEYFRASSLPITTSICTEGNQDRLSSVIFGNQQRYSVSDNSGQPGQPIFEISRSLLIKNFSDPGSSCKITSVSFSVTLNMQLVTKR